MKKSKILAICFFVLFTFPIIFNVYATNIATFEVIPQKRATYDPFVEVNAALDKNGNKIDDQLEQIVSKGFISTYYDTIVTFDEPVNNEIIKSIEAVGGVILSTWTLINGAAVRIKSTDLTALSTIAEVSFVARNARTHAKLSTSVPQINVRPYVWDTLGYEGDSGTTIAILDTGVDDSHSDLSGKVSYWKDFIGADVAASGDLYVTATDENGHGTHCSSIAVGSGAASGTASTVEVTGTLGVPETLSGGSGYVVYIEVEATGTVTVDFQWEEEPGPSGPTDTLFVMIDVNNNGAFDDAYVTVDYNSQPGSITTGTLSPGFYPMLIGAETDSEIDRCAIIYTITRPASSTSDGNNKYRGVAPGCDVVGLKVLDDSGYGTSVILLNALNWISANGLTYNIDVVSMSLGLDAVLSAVDTAINNLVGLGYACVAAAGNGFTDGITITSPGTAEKAITVGAIDDVDKIAIYSSNGPSSSGKPDVVAPGGAYQYFRSTDEDTHPIIAADSNDADVIEIGNTATPTYWETDVNANDYAGFQGTSMATPHIAGLVALLIDAMGVDWTHSEADVLEIKNYLCGTATEVTYGEELDVYHNEPTLNRGDADLVEGFGKVHGDAAIEAFLSTYTAGDTVTETLSNSPTGAQSWARKVELVGGIEFTAGIDMDGTADYDLYLYDPSQDMSQYLGYLASSTSAGTGLPENILYTPSSDMTAYIVIKRVSGYGSFTLQAEATNVGTPTSSGGFTFPFDISILAWIALGTLGLASITFVYRKQRK